MARTVSIGRQDFRKLRQHHNFYIDKTHFIKEWWEADDEVTLITRPRRFGKTLNMSMVEQFFSVEYMGQGELFEGLSVWEDEGYRKLQGTYPVISLSFANIKETEFETARRKICQILADVFSRNRFLLETEILDTRERRFFEAVSMDMEDAVATLALHQLSGYLSRYYRKNVIILLDEYDTPMQEAYVNGFWRELVDFTRSLFNATFKTNPYLERALMTGITRVSKESIFSDLNNLEVVTTTTGKYADCFGFKEEEVFQALDEFGLSSEKEEVKKWYDGFRFGNTGEIYNPWSILNYLDKKCVGLYWANTSSNGLVGKLLREGSREVKQDLETLLLGNTIQVGMDEQIVYDQLDVDETAIWSLLLASGYLKVIDYEAVEEYEDPKYEMALTNLEVRRMFRAMVRGWFRGCQPLNNAFLQAFLKGNLDEMNEYMNDIAAELFSSFDTGRNPSKKAQPERFYHGFVLGLLVELQGKYVITSNRESGFGRYDVMLEPRDQTQDAFVIEFKAANARKEESLEAAVSAALEQIQEKGYEAALTARGFAREQIKSYGFAFCGKEVLIGASIS